MAYDYVESVQRCGRPSYERHVADIDNLSSHAFVLAEKLWSRLAMFLDTRIPEKELILKPGNNWVWKAFKSKLVRIAVLMILWNTVPKKENLLLRRSEDSELPAPPISFCEG